MKRAWTIIGVSDVLGSNKWYQALFGQPETLPAHDDFGQILDSDGTVFLCLHEWGAHEHPSLMSPDRGTPAMAFSCSFVLMISTWPSEGHALSAPGSKRSLTSIRTPERRSSRSEIRMDTMSRPVRYLRPSNRWRGT
jgi:hypothetical protein